ncbi:MAG: NTP transferase domain-containing protein [Candidatus Delongbacteria bacterium]|nr:NTP transferase domain-containing protein [Candidatus Delongbacteria bacterium]
MKAIIPVAGMGTRLRPLTLSQPKVLVPVAGRALLDWILDELQAAGLRQVVFITGWLGAKVQAHVERHWPDLDCRFIEQTSMLGLGHAVHLGLEDDDEDVLIVLGDTLFKADIAAMRARPASVLGVRQVEDPRRFGVAETEGARILRLVEKPEHPRSNLALVGLYCIRDGAALKHQLEAMMAAGRRTRGEFQITDALQAMIDAGEPFEAQEITDWFDCGNRETLLATNRHYLERMSHSHVEFPGSVLHPPVWLGEGVTLENCVLGPHVSVGPGSRLSRCVIRDSVVGEGARLENAVLAGSIVGEEASVKRSEEILNLSAHAESVSGLQP